MFFICSVYTLSLLYIYSIYRLFIIKKKVNYLAGAGTQSAGLSMGGNTGSNSNVTEEYDGSAWSASANLATARHFLAGAGTTSAGLSIGGYVSTASAITEEYGPDIGSYAELFHAIGAL